VKQAIEIFSIMKKELGNSLTFIIDKVDNMELQVIELTKAIETTNGSSDINLSLFSPYENKQKLSEVKKLEAKLRTVNENLPKLLQELSSIQEKDRKSNLIRECLEYMKTIVEEDLLNTKSEEPTNTTEVAKYGNDVFDVNFDNSGLKILETQELERQRIARDLHDSTIQNLTNLMHKTELCLKLFDIDTIRARLEMAAMIESVRFIINSMRDIIYNLRPMSIQDLGLVPTIESFVKNFKQRNHFQVLLTCQEEKYNLLPVINLSLYRIVQEACNNIEKYAQATVCKITLNYEKNYVKLVIEDNGKGIEEKKKVSGDNENCGFGLSIMRERVSLLSGDLSIESKKGKGTKIKVTIPYREHKGD
jgi:two-component system sensor histidine kinase DegS